jgi:hypothetical protein
LLALGLAQQLHPLRHDRRVPDSHARKVAAGSVQAGHKAKLKWIARDAEDNRNRAIHTLGRNCTGSAAGHGDHRHMLADQLGQESRYPVVVIVGLAILDRDIAALDITGFFQPLLKGAQPICGEFTWLRPNGMWIAMPSLPPEVVCMQ